MVKGGWSGGGGAERHVGGWVGGGKGGCGEKFRASLPSPAAKFVLFFPLWGSSHRIQLVFEAPKRSNVPGGFTRHPENSKGAHLRVSVFKNTTNENTKKEAKTEFCGGKERKKQGRSVPGGSRSVSGGEGGRSVPGGRGGGGAVPTGTEKREGGSPNGGTRMVPTGGRSKWVKGGGLKGDGLKRAGGGCGAVRGRGGAREGGGRSRPPVPRRGGSWGEAVPCVEGGPAEGGETVQTGEWGGGGAWPKSVWPPYWPIWFRLTRNVPNRPIHSSC